MRYLVVMMAVGAGCAGGEPYESEIDAAIAALSPTPPAVGGCADLFALGRNDADDAGIVVQVDAGLATDAETSGTLQSASFTLPDPAVPLLEVQTGSEITAAYCNDVGGVGTVDHRAVAVAGQVDVEVDPDGTVGTGTRSAVTALVTLTDLTLEDPDTGDQYALPLLEIADVVVAWLPG